MPKVTKAGHFKLQQALEMGPSDIELVKATKADARQVYDSWGYNPDNFLYLSAPPQTCVDDAQNYLDHILANSGDPVFHIHLRETRQTVGLIKAKVEGHKALVGYALDKPVWGRGIATRALRQLIAHLAQDETITRIWATCATNNPGSARVLEKCGFVREGTLKNWIVYPAQGSYAHDNFCYFLEQVT